MRFYLVYCATIFFILTVQTIGLAQNEKLDDPYISLPKTQQKISAPYHAAGLNYWTVQVNVDSDGNDILNDAANEPSIAINAQNPKHMVIGWRQFDDITNNFRQAGYAYTTDGGQHWTFPGVIQPGIFRSDPVLESDPDGNILYNSLAIEPNFHCTVFKSNGIGAWDGGVEAFGGDKQWMAVDKTEGPGKGNIYSNWSYGASSCEGDYARSIDNGASFESCETYDPNSYWGTMAIGPDGTVYVSAGNGTIARSNNAQFKDQVELWEILFADYGGIPKSFQTDSPNPGGLLGQPWIATNHAQNNLNGQIYVACSVNTQNNDPLDVFFNRSTDKGETWGVPVRLNDDDPNDLNWQWFGTMSVAPNGRIDVIWLDTRDNPGTYLSSLYYTNSMDGGDSWLPNQRLSMAFDPWIGWPNQSKMGDYFHMISDSTGANLAWAGTFSGGQDVYFTRIEVQNPTAIPEIPTPLVLSRPAPNPFRDQCTLRYQLQVLAPIRLEILDAVGRRVSIFDEGTQAPGAHSLVWNGKDGSGQDLSSGIYYARIWMNGISFGTEKIVLMR